MDCHHHCNQPVLILVASSSEKRIVFILIIRTKLMAIIVMGCLHSYHQPFGVLLVSLLVTIICIFSIQIALIVIIITMNPLHPIMTILMDHGHSFMIIIIRRRMDLCYHYLCYRLSIKTIIIRLLFFSEFCRLFSFKPGSIYLFLPSCTAS